ncbi:MAG TPA: Hsp20/alpha crystallin family protein [Blastocatellia bacterium]|nr:Hsp20/alpha crystallin family protein [Blastocatellia bacterium]
MARGRRVLLERFHSDSYRRPSGPLWQPAVDVYKTPDGWKIKFDLAGVKPNDVEVVLLDGRIVVRGVRRDSVISEGWSYYQLEITYSRFERVLQIPCDLSNAEIKTESCDGWFILNVTGCSSNKGYQEK